MICKKEQRQLRLVTVFKEHTEIILRLGLASSRSDKSMQIIGYVITMRTRVRCILTTKSAIYPLQQYLLSISLTVFFTSTTGYLQTEQWAST